ncbi:hypothetical protein ACFLYV_00430 [Chloroflexota bacterium]
MVQAGISGGHLGKTIVEKILSASTGTDAKAGDIVISRVDFSFVQDTTGPLTVRQFEAAGFAGVAVRDRTTLFIDNAVPSPKCFV